MMESIKFPTLVALIVGKFKTGEIVELKFEGGRYWTDYGYEYDYSLEWKQAKGLE